MNDLEVVKELEAQRVENQSLRTDLAKALASLEQANTRIGQLERLELAQKNVLSKLGNYLIFD